MGKTDKEIFFSVDYVLYQTFSLETVLIASVHADLC